MLSAGHAQARPLGLPRLALTAAACVLLAALFGGGGAIAPQQAVAQVCPPQPTGLNPLGASATRFTMLLRINTDNNVTDYSNPEAIGGMRERIRANDIFVINTRFTGNASGTEPPVTPAFATVLANQIRTAFPCNRIIGLNGLSFDPAAPGYAFSLIDHPAVFALMSDYEPMDWNAGRATDPTRPSWNQKYKTALARIKAWMGLLSGTLASNPIGASKRAGLVPIDISKWNYGEIAQAIDKKNIRLGGRHLGPQSVQTQDSCANGGAGGFAARFDRLKDQYRFKFIRKTVKRKGKKKKITIRRKLKKMAKPNRANLAMQISFSDTPNPSAGMAITKTSPGTAAACTQAGLDQGQGAFFYFAASEAMRLFFLQPQIAALRPPSI
jgi:hypothetical protein